CARRRGGPYAPIFVLCLLAYVCSRRQYLRSERSGVAKGDPAFDGGCAKRRQALFVHFFAADYVRTKRRTSRPSSRTFRSGEGNGGCAHTGGNHHPNQREDGRQRRRRLEHQVYGTRMRQPQNLVAGGAAASSRKQLFPRTRRPSLAHA